MKTTARKTAVLAGLALTIACAGIAPAAVASSADGAAGSGESQTVRVAGRQIPVDIDNGLYEMRGSLIGDWHYIPKEVLHNDPEKPTLYVEAGVEVFNGCIDRRPRDGKCTGRDYSGELHLAFLYWASYDPSGNLIKGQCVHPITGGKGAFAGARGLLNMVDRPVRDQVRTTYRGQIELNAVPTEGDADTPLASSEAETTVDQISSATSGRRVC
jgi:hypothetical protein